MVNSHDVPTDENGIPIGYVFVCAKSHRALAKLKGRFPGTSSHYRKFSSENRGPHNAYLITSNQFEMLKVNPIKGVSKVRHQSVSEWYVCF